VGADVEGVGHFLVGEASSQADEDFFLTAGEDFGVSGSFLLELPDDEARHARGHGRPALVQVVEGFHQFPGRAAFQNIAGGPGLEGVEDGLPVFEDRVGHDVQVRVQMLGFPDEIDPRHAREPEIGQEDVG